MKSHTKIFLSTTLQGPSLNLKQLPQKSMKAFSVDDITASSKVMTPYRKINIAREKIINYRVTSPSNYSCQIRIAVQERPGILVTIHFFLFVRYHNEIFKLLTLVHSYAMSNH